MTKILAIVALCAVLFIPASSGAKQLSAGEKLQATAEAFIEKWFAFDPVIATEMGDHTNDYRYPDFSQKSFGRYAAALRDLRNDLNGISQQQLNADEKLDYLTLQSDIETQLLYLSRSLILQDNPKLFSGKAIDGLYQVMQSQSLSDTSKFEYILGRLNDLPRFLESAQRLLKEPPQIWILLAEDEVERTTTFLTDLADYFGDRLPHRSDELKEKIATAANSLEDFSDFLDALKTKEGQQFAVGKELFDKLLKQQLYVDYDSDSLLKIGEAQFAEAARLYDSVSAIVDTLPLPEDFAYFVPKSFSRADVMDYFQWEINQTRDWLVAHDFATIPSNIAPCVPEETPAFAERLTGGIICQTAGPFESAQTSRFHVQPLPDTLSDANRSAYFRYCTRRGFRPTVVHEAYPGRHLQIQMTNHNPSLLRRVQRDEMMTGGWPLYCEGEIYDEAFYGDDLRTYLTVLNGVRFRAARIIVDVKLQTGQFTYQQAVDWMVANLDAEVDYIEKEVNSYTLEPTVPSSYLLGKDYLLKIRDLYKTKMGQQYTLKRFHDFILQQGTISPVLIYKQMSGQIF